MDKNMYSEKFLKFIEMWENDFGIKRTIDEKVCVDRDNNPIPWYTYPAIEYISQFDYTDKTVFEFGCGYSSMFWAKRAKKVISIINANNLFIIPPFLPLWAFYSLIVSYIAHFVNVFSL